MNNDALKPSPEFRKMAIRAFASIALFVFTYLFVVLFAIGLTFCCGYLGYLLFNAYSTWFTAVIALMMVAGGVIVLIFVVKFIFKRPERNKPLYVEINATEEPELFSLIEEVVAEVKTSSPKRVYLSPEVNAGVFYDSLFLSMFFPVRMNLQIGMGILNTHTVEELKAVLAHEFGHFSQRSMRLGSYVHNANKVLHNLLYDNDNFDRNVEAWGNLFSYFKIAVLIATVTIKGMQSTLKKVYEILNVNYFALSRQMEYHADAVAATVGGSIPMISSLLRLEAAETSLNIVYAYYEDKIKEGVRPLNLYPQQYHAMNHFAQQQRIGMKYGLPEISLENIWKSRRSKIVWPDQWSTHPNLEDRIKRVKTLSAPNTIERRMIAVNILANKDRLQETLTSKIFEHHFIYAKEPALTDFEQFKTDFLNQSSEVFFDERYYGYFDNKLPYYKFDQKGLDKPAFSNLSYDELFNNESLTNVIEQDVLENDINILEKIKSEPGGLKTYDYDGITYQIDDSGQLIEKLRKELEEVKRTIDEGDLQIFEYFKSRAGELDKLEGWKENCLRLKEVAELTFLCQDAYIGLTSASEFMNVTTSFAEIREKMVFFKEAEGVLKAAIKTMLENPVYKAETTPEQVLTLENYLLTDLTFFANNSYIEEDINMIMNLLPVFQAIYFNTCAKHKKNFLKYQSGLFPETSSLLTA